MRDVRVFFTSIDGHGSIRESVWINILSNINYIFVSEVITVSLKSKPEVSGNLRQQVIVMDTIKLSLSRCHAAYLAGE